MSARTDRAPGTLPAKQPVREPVATPAITGLPAVAACLARAEACTAAGDRRGQAAALFEARVRGASPQGSDARLRRVLAELGVEEDQIEPVASHPLRLASVLTCSEEWSETGYRATRERLDDPTIARGGWGFPVNASRRCHRVYCQVVAAVLWAGPLAAFLLGRHMTAFAELRYLPWPLALGLSCAFVPSLMILSVVVATGIRRLVRSISAWSMLRRGLIRIESKSRRLQYRWHGDERLFRIHPLLYAVSATYESPPATKGAHVELSAPATVWYGLRVGQEAPVWFIEGQSAKPGWSRFGLQTEWNLDSRRGPVLLPLVGFALLAAFSGLFGAVVVAVVQAVI